MDILRSNKQGANLPTSAKAGHYCQCPRTDTEIGRGECFRETAKTAEDGRSYGKDGSGHGKVGHTDFTFYNSRTHFVKRHTFYISRTHFVKRPN